MLDSFTGGAWVERVLLDIAESDFAQLALVILNGESRDRPLWTRARALAPTLLYAVYERLDRRWFGTERNPFAPRDLSSVLDGVEVLPVIPRRRRFVHRFEPADVGAIRAHDLDVILRFGFNIIRGSVLEASRYGVWSYHHGDNREYRGGPMCFWEVYEGCPRTGSMLQILNEELDGGKVIYRSTSATDMISLQRSREGVFLKSTAFVIRRLRDLHHEGFGFLEKLETCHEQIEYERGIFRRPRNATTLRHLARIGARKLRSAAQARRLKNQWSVGVRRLDDSALAAPPERGKYTWIEPPRDRFYADPIPFEKNGEAYVFFEDYAYVDRRACISCVSIDGDGIPGGVTRVLERPYHLSYPYVFSWRGTVYMIPETEQNRTIELYRAVEFPRRWELERVLFENVRAVDSTVLEHEGRLWLFAAMSRRGSSIDDELFLFHAEQPAGPWQPHPRNPIVSDVTRARPAGPLFYSGGSLIRPGQDGSVRYGYAIALHRVDLLSETAYREVPIGRIEPSWYPGAIGTHTLARSEHFETIDIKKRVPR